MAVIVDGELAIAEQVGVEFMLPSLEEPITVRAFVRNRTGSCYGIEFISENDEDYYYVGLLEAALNGHVFAHTEKARAACA